MVIDPLVEADIREFLPYRQDPDVARWQSWTPEYSRADALRLVSGQPSSELPGVGGWIQLALRSTDRMELLGDVGIHRLDDQPDTFEIGITLAAGAQGQGLATEALEAVLEFLFKDGAAHRVVAQCDARNEPVARLLRRVGFRQESRQVDADYFKGEWTTLDGYALLAGEYNGATERKSGP
ncbi:MAG TPA: GNAT family protein [Glaciibacter sp.]|nr:GNAT family protein [Glaciibacter sp.]